MPVLPQAERSAVNKKELESALLKLQEENVRLKEELAYVKFELEELRSKRYKSGKRNDPPDDTDGHIPCSPKKRGGLFGHIGWFRKKPKKIDRVEDVRLDSCPSCGSNDITECETIDNHIQEDIVLPKVEVTLYRKHRYYCGKCKKVISPAGKDEIPHSYIGPRAKALAVFLRYAVKISERDVRALFEKAFNLRIVTSSIAGFRDKLMTEAMPIYKQLMVSLRRGAFIHADETGWSINGTNHWLWKFSNKKVCVTHIDKSRGQGVVDTIIGDSYSGVLITDFLSAYNKIGVRAKQRCLVHILRDLKKVMEYWHDDQEVLRYCGRLKKILEDAICLHAEYKNRRRDKGYYQTRDALKRSLDDFGFPNPNKRILRRFAKRLERHKGEIVTFLYEKNIDYHNNHAEQQIRPDVIFRKITFGNRSCRGAENHSVIMSIIQTAKLNGINPLEALLKLLVRDGGSPLDSVAASP